MPLPVSPTSSTDSSIGDADPRSRGRTEESKGVAQIIIKHPKVGEHVGYWQGEHLLECEVSQILHPPLPGSKSVGQYRLLDLHMQLRTGRYFQAGRGDIEYPYVGPGQPRPPR